MQQLSKSGFEADFEMILLVFFNVYLIYLPRQK